MKGASCRLMFISEVLAKHNRLAAARTVALSRCIRSIGQTEFLLNLQRSCVTLKGSQDE